MSELCDLSAVELRRAIGAGEISPVELLESCQARINAVNPALNAVVARDEPSARQAAEAAEKVVRQGDDLGPLHGLPLGIKDLNETAGLRTTYGSPLFADFVPQADSGVVAGLRAAGGVILAKTNTPEFGAGANTTNAVYGFTGNPFDPNKTCAGSSGGSAVALATSMLPLCNGSDLGGSLRTPASFCGVVGLRPTAGLVPKVAPIAFSPLSVEGPMARSVEDLALFLSAMARDDAADPFARPQDPGAFAHCAAGDLSKLRVAFSEDLGFAPVERAVRSLFRSRTGQIRHLFAEAQDRDPDIADGHRVFEVLRGVGFLAAHLDKYRQTPELVGPNVTANVELGLTFDAADVAAASRRHSDIYRGFLDFMGEVDLLITPAAAARPFTKDRPFVDAIDGAPLETYIQWVAISYGITLTGHPALCLPCGLDADGMPFGLQIVGRRFGESALLAAGLALEQALSALPDCRRPLPDLAGLAKLAA